MQSILQTSTGFWADIWQYLPIEFKEPNALYEREK